MSYLTDAQLDKYSQIEERGKNLASISRIKDIEKRRQGKSLKVHAFPQNTTYVPAIKVSGLWLSYFGFELGDTVTLIAKENEIVIRKARKEAF